MNVHRRREAIGTYSLYPDTLAIDNGSTSTPIFDDVESFATGMKTDKQFVTTLEDVIPQCGAPTKLISDREQVEISNKVLAILHALVIGDWQCEPYYQHQNITEHHWQTVKHIADTIVDRTGSPPYTCLLALIYASFV